MSDRPLTPLALHILIALGAGPSHGYAVLKDIESRAGEAVPVRSGTLYVAMKRLSEQGLIEDCAPPGDETVDARRRYFRLTGSGRETLTLELERLDQWVHAARSRLAPVTGRSGSES